MSEPLRLKLQAGLWSDLFTVPPILYGAPPGTGAITPPTGIRGVPSPGITIPGIIITGIMIIMDITAAGTLTATPDGMTFITLADVPIRPVSYTHLRAHE